MVSELNREKSSVIERSENNNFIIIATKRTGSNLLVRSLRESKKITCYGELIAPNYSNQKNSENIFHKVAEKSGMSLEKLYTLQKENPINFIEVIFNLQTNRKLGFKLFYEHIYPANVDLFWDYVKKQKNLKIVHLVRENLLDILVSYKYASLNNSWIKISAKEAKQNSNYDSDSIVINPEECKEFFQLTQRRIEDTRNKLQSHNINYLNICYQDLSNNYQESMHDIFDFLAVDRADIVQMPTKKQSARSNNSRIKNYQQLAEFFEKTEWNVFF